MSPLEGDLETARLEAAHRLKIRQPNRLTQVPADVIAGPVHRSREATALHRPARIDGLFRKQEQRGGAVEHVIHAEQRQGVRLLKAVVYKAQDPPKGRGE